MHSFQAIVIAIQKMVHNFGKPYVYLGYQCSLLLEYLAYVHGQHHVTEDITLVSAICLILQIILQGDNMMGRD